MPNAVVSNTTPNSVIVTSEGKATFQFLKWMQNVGSTVNGAFDSDGNYQGPIGSRATIVGRQFLATIVSRLTDAGIITPAGLPAATTTEQGAVILPAGAGSNTLGTAAIQPSTAFDANGAAAEAQANAQAFATAAANTAQSNAESFASNASNLSSGTVDPTRLSGITTVIVTAALTLAGTQGSMTFQNGLLVAESPAS